MTAKPAARLNRSIADKWLLCGARVAIDPTHAVRAMPLIIDGRISEILPGSDPPANVGKDIRIIYFKDQIILPGLINAHDHLQFGLFPRLGRGPYPSWHGWADDIYRPQQDPLRTLLQIPRETRLWSGICRNLLSGVTTVCHHDKLHPLLASSCLPITVHSAFGWAHSLDNDLWRERYAQTPADWPFIVHCAEGVNLQSRREVTKFRRRAELGNRVVFIHAVGVSKRDWLVLRAAKTWIVWCPSSNLHILGRTLARELILTYPFMVLGSDSPISAAGDLIDELHLARALYDLPPELLYRMVTIRPARLLRRPAGSGSVARDCPADLLVLNDTLQTPCECLAALSRDQITAVMHNGRIVVVSGSYCHQRDHITWRTLSSVTHRGIQWFVSAPAEALKAYCNSRRQEPTKTIQAELTNQ